MLHKAIKFCIENKLVAFVMLFLLCAWGFYHAPFRPVGDFLPSDPVSVDAIPDIGDNQQIVYTEWEGQSPREIEDQITYPLTSQLLGMPGVRTIRSTSMFGFSSIHVIFEDGVDFYWSRSRILEKINSLPKGLLPQEVSPSLGPDATALGQVFWYTLEGRDEDGRVTGGWDLHELRTIQDFYLKNALTSTPGISEVASIGGYVREYQIDLDPEMMRQYGILLPQVVKAVRESNRDVGARTLEINNVEYFIRGLGYVASLSDIEDIQVGGSDFRPIYLGDIAVVSQGPAERRGILDKGGAEVVGGVAIAQFGANPLQVIRDLKANIRRISPGLPSRILEDGRRSQLQIVPFYDRTVLIRETLNTLGHTLGFEILITILVVILMLRQLRISLLISSLMPIAVLAVFGLMKLFHVDANIVALSGIAIAIGTLVDLAIILTENVVRHFQMGDSRPNDLIVYDATREVSGAILTAGMTTIVSFIPVFSLTGPEGKLFTPLAFTKTAALAVSMLVVLFLLPPIVAILFRSKQTGKIFRITGYSVLFLTGIWALTHVALLGAGIILYCLVGVLGLAGKVDRSNENLLKLALSVFLIIGLLSRYWRPLGFSSGLSGNAGFVIASILAIIGSLQLLRHYYTRILAWALEHKPQFLAVPALAVVFGALVMATTEKEFMPALDEGSFLLMPVSMPHAGITENGTVLQKLDRAVAGMPEVELVVGKAGRVTSALDPAPLSMYENLIQYKPEFLLDSVGKPVRFAVDANGRFQTRKGEWVDSAGGLSMGDLVPDPSGAFYRNWRPHIHTVSDIWKEIQAVTRLPGVTTPPRLQPIETRLVMLQTGMRSAMGIKVKGPDLETIENFGIELEALVKHVKGIDPASVFADRIVSKPYLELAIDRKKAARYDVSVNAILEVIEVAIGGKILSYTVEGLERYGIRIRYPRELRNTPEELSKMYIEVSNGSKVPLSEVVTINYSRGPQAVRSEDSFPVSYVIFDKNPGISENTAVDRVRTFLEQATRDGNLIVPDQVSYEFSGNYLNQQRAEKRLAILVPLVLLIIFMILYLQFRSVWVSLMVFSAVAVAFAGGFILIWVYSQSWFLDFNLFGQNFREYFGLHQVYLSVAVWVGFIALFGIATDDGVVMATYLRASFRKNRPKDVAGIRNAVVEGGLQRLRPCLMTSGTTLLALLPVLTSTGRGSDVMVPMAIPCMGGMVMALLSLFMVPVLYSWREENRIKKLQDGR